MPIIYRGTQVDRVIYKGVELDTVFYRGVEVFSSGFVLNHTLNTTFNNFNLVNWLTSVGWDGVQPISGTLTLGSSFRAYSNSATSPAFRIPTLPQNSSFDIVLEGEIQGRGGNGGDASLISASNGQRGGTGLRIDQQSSNVVIHFRHWGIIGGGGGGGGGASLSWDDGTKVGRLYIADAGGGGGARHGSGGGVGTGGSDWATSPGSAGTATTGGSGGQATVSSLTARGGRGGNRGQSGSPGTTNGIGHPRTGQGGAAGYSISGARYILLTNLDGTIYGPIQQ